ncbi:MAG: hypothetical protein Dasosvirus7_11 [Dasosvirus sp.]|uniref:Glycosyl transferase family 25 domain-containing protein n=1 Tax=Dasosvirus sp. TaxID=2487764 RepID=A0A3G4ZTB4_9VIRU|nr:MAG: hypothetical protein Dasosvirus7_11 [Dasosvirus sp.]
MDIYDLPLYYISFYRNFDLEKELKSIGFRNVHLFRAVNGKNMNPTELVKSNKITIRSYIDLMTNQEQRYGLPHLGAVGCTFSHLALWQLCIDCKHQYMIIVEDDVCFPNGICDNDLSNIRETLYRDKSSIFIGSKLENKFGLTYFIGSQFYIVSLDACYQLVKYALPIDVQTDAYIAYLANVERINLGGYGLSSQKEHPNTIQIK